MPTIQFKNSSTASNVPSSLQVGEIAVNHTDQKVYIGTSGGVATIVGTAGNQDANNVAITGGAMTGVSVGSTTASTVAASSLTMGSTTVSAIDNDTTMSANTNSNLPTQNAVSSYLQNNLRGRLKNIYTFTSSGTYTKSGSDVSTIHVILVGGGGGGTSYSISGGAGGYSETLLNASSITSVSVTVGGGSGGASYYSNIGAGGTSSFGGYISAAGGYGADANHGHTGGYGGYGYGGIVTATGGSSGGHNNMDQWSHSNSPDSTGGVSFFGGGMSGFHTSRPGSNHGAYGAGGACVSTGHNGQGGYSGQGGIVIVYEYR
jgi:hypothetical protein